MSISLKSQHLIISSELVESYFQNSPYVLLSYKEEIGKLLISPVDNAWFTKMHKADQYFLKQRNLKGDNSTGIHALLLDFDLDDSDRDLSFSENSTSNFLSVDIK